MNLNFYDSALDGQNPLIGKKGPAQSRSFYGNFGGSLVKERSSFSVSLQRSDSYATPNLCAQTLEGKVAQNLDMHQPRGSTYLSALFDLALTKDQTLRVSYSHSGSTTDNQGVGAYDFPERAYSTEPGRPGLGYPSDIQPAHRRSEHRLSERARRLLPAGRHPRSQEPHAQPRRPIRGTDSCPRHAERGPAFWHHLGAVQERQDDAAHELGIFYDWLSDGTYEQTLLVEGYRLRQVNMVNTPDNPLAYPDPGPVDAQATDRYLLGDVLMGRNMRLSAGIEQRLAKWLRVGATYANIHGDNLLTGTNLNPPDGGVRPDPAFKNVIETTAAGKSRIQSLSTNISVSLSPASPTSGMSGPLLSLRRGLSVYTSYYVYRSRNNTEGAFSVPASGTLATEWGPSGSDVHNRVNLGIYSAFFRNLTATLSISAYSGAPYTMRLAYDANGDGLFNDRPDGVGRNTLRAPGQWNAYAYFTYTIGIGRRKVSGPGITLTSSGAGGYAVSSTMQESRRYRLRIGVTIDNPTNHANYTGYSGTVDSPFFMRPTSVSGVRQVYLTAGFSF
jgi:hypothetical protein